MDTKDRRQNRRDAHFSSISHMIRLEQRESTKKFENIGSFKPHGVRCIVFLAFNACQGHPNSSAKLLSNQDYKFTYIIT